MKMKFRKGHSRWFPVKIGGYLQILTSGKLSLVEKVTVTGYLDENPDFRVRVFDFDFLSPYSMTCFGRLAPRKRKIHFTRNLDFPEQRPTNYDSYWQGTRT